MKKTTMLRNLLKEPGVLVAAGVYDCTSVRVAEAVGYKVAFMPGGSFRPSMLGVPNISGIASATEVVNCARYIANSANIPLVVDADDGYGGALATYRTVQELIRAGAAGCHIDDQKHLTDGALCPYMAVPEVISRDEYYGKVGAALEARDKEDKDFVLIARIDAGATPGDEEVVARAKACIKLGADMILPHPIPSGGKFPVRDKEAWKKLNKEIGAPQVHIWASLGMQLRELETAEAYEEMLTKFRIGVSPLGAVRKLLFDEYQLAYDTGKRFDRYTPKTNPPGKFTMQFAGQLSGLDFWTELEKKYVLD